MRIVFAFVDAIAVAIYGDFCGNVVFFAVSAFGVVFSHTEGFDFLFIWNLCFCFWFLCFAFVCIFLFWFWPFLAFLVVY
jgi:hypothetical protein